jgi:hypothetical protein
MQLLHSLKSTFYNVEQLTTTVMLPVRVRLSQSRGGIVAVFPGFLGR